MSNDFATYLGNKGYTIYKENLEIQEQELIRKELSISPYVPKNSFRNQYLFQYIENLLKILLTKILWY